MLRRVATIAPRVASRAFSSTYRPAIPSLVSTISRLPSSRRSYHERVLDHYSNPRNVGSLNKKDGDVGTGLVGAPACGDVMKLQIRVDPKDNTISEVKFKTFGCGSAIASSSYLTELVQGMTLEKAGKIRNTEIAQELNAIKSAINDYYTKNPKAKSTDLGGTGAAMPKVEVETVMGGSQPQVATA